jgi:hypothetical protein
VEKESNTGTIFPVITLGMSQRLHSPRLLNSSAPGAFCNKSDILQHVLKPCLGSQLEENFNLCEDLQAIFADKEA